jgi:MoCo/4Fe-4S cofactor protein with predicted Tat translocation signal
MSNEPETTNIEDTRPATGDKAARMEAMRAKLVGKQGKAFWRSFEELADTPEFNEWVHDEIPNRASLLNVDRRKFLQIGASALALAGLSGCRILPPQRAVAHVRSPEEQVPSQKLIYATALTRSGYATGVLVESAEGRPIKVEGNPAHPASLGSTLVWEQAEVLNLYDPERSQMVRTRIKPGDAQDISEGASWDQALSVVRRSLVDRAAANGEGFAILTETLTSPSLIAQIEGLVAKYPRARWVQYEPINRDNVYAGTEAAFGRPLNPVYRLAGARVVLSLDGDFFSDMPGSVRYSRDFASGRKVRKANPKMNRLYAIESSYTITGATADHRLAVKPSEIEAVARALYAAVSGESDSAPASVPAAWMTALVKDLQANAGAAVVIPGEHTTPATQALCHAVNAALGAVGNTVVYTEPVGVATQQTAALRNLVGDMAAGRVQTLLILGGNPVYTAPADLKFAEALDKVPLRVHLGLYDDETSALCHWHLPESHPFEAWGDARAFDGTVTVSQPLIAPLYETKTATEFLHLAQGGGQDGYDIVKTYWQGKAATANYARWWEKSVHDGVVPNSALPTVAATVRPGVASALPSAPATPAGSLEVNFRPDPSLYDGRWANNAWLQELPKPITTICWDNVAIFSPETARKIGLIPNDAANDARNIAQIVGKKVVELAVGGQTLKMPVWILPGQPDDTVTVHLGFGRVKAGIVGNGAGFNTYAIRTTTGLDYAPATVKDTGLVGEVVYTQIHHTMRGERQGNIGETENRPIVLAATLAEYVEKNGEVLPHAHIPETLVATGYGKKFEEAGAKPEAGGEHGGDSHAGEHGGEHGGGHGPKKVEQPSHGFTHAKVVDETPEQGKEAYADPLRHNWKYAERSVSNKEGWPSLYPEYSNKGYNAWGMSVDLTLCTGCNACVVACQAENNVPVVGKDQVGRGREMHWIRIDHYYATDEDWKNPESYFQPVACVHCEKAPCEPVCPVAATIHNHEGLNQMIYNRCIGTRYCSNNCPYKVRRFNFLKWVQGAGGETTLNYYDKPQLQMLTNPDVTLRGRGVMEKCTYCVQRINAARIEAKKAGREIADGEVITACQQACPTQTIVFGDINNPNSEVSKLRAEPADYSLLSDLNTRPRTTYLARIKNLNPEIEALKPNETPAEAPKAPASGGAEG